MLCLLNKGVIKDPLIRKECVEGKSRRLGGRRYGTEACACWAAVRLDGSLLLCLKAAASTEQDSYIQAGWWGPCSDHRAALEDKEQAGDSLLQDCVAERCCNFTQWFSRTPQPAHLSQANVSCDSEINNFIINKGSVAGEEGDLWLNSPVASGAALQHQSLS